MVWCSASRYSPPPGLPLCGRQRKELRMKKKGKKEEKTPKKGK
jgi:hypothetical protein